MTTIQETRPDAIGAQLRTWRERRRLSQLELSSRAAVSTRHLSYVETGRSRPTPEMIERLADHLEVPLRDRNRLLLAGGYAPRYSAAAVDDTSLAVVMDGLRGLLDAHLPYPALLLDEHWDIVDANAAVDVLLGSCDPALLEPPVNAIRVSVDPRGLAPRIRNLPEWAAHLHHQVARRAEHTGDAVLTDLAAEIANAVQIPMSTPPGGPVLSLDVETDAGLLRFFSVAASLQTATDATVEGLHLETFLPADEATRAALASRG